MGVAALASAVVGVAPGIGFSSPTVISTRSRAGPNALTISVFTFSTLWSVVRMLNRDTDRSSPTFKLSTVTAGRTLAVSRT